MSAWFYRICVNKKSISGENFCETGSGSSHGFSGIRSILGVESRQRAPKTELARYLKKPRNFGKASFVPFSLFSLSSQRNSGRPPPPFRDGKKKKKVFWEPATLLFPPRYKIGQCTAATTHPTPTPHLAADRKFAAREERKLHLPGVPSIKEDTAPSKRGLLQLLRVSVSSFSAAPAALSECLASSQRGMSPWKEMLLSAVV